MLTVGGLVTWLIARKPSSKITVTKQFTYDFSLPLPEMRIQFRDKTMGKLFMARYLIKNIGDKVLDKPNLVANLVDKTAEVVGVNVTIFPKRQKSDGLFETKTQGNEFVLTPTTFFPYSLNREIITLDIFTSKPTKIEFSGVGVNQDNTGWAVNYDDGNDLIKVDFLGVWSPRKEYVYGFVLYVALILTIIGIIGFFAWCFTSKLIAIDAIYLQFLLSSKWFWIFLFWTVSILIVSLYFGIKKDWVFPIPLFFGRVLYINLRVGKRFDD